MCAIIDANVADQVFGHRRAENRPIAGVEFFNWINTGRGRLIVGGKLLNELERTSMKVWVQQAIASGRITRVANAKVAETAAELGKQGLCRSNDTHVLALARASGARLLYSNDKDLIQDFKNKMVINKPRGNVYTTHVGEGHFEASHKLLLRKKGLCG